MMNAQKSADRPLLAITMGDPSGIGPEIVLKALSDLSLLERCRPLVVGDRRILERAMAWQDVPALPINAVSGPAESQFEPGTVTLVEPHPVDPEACPVGQISETSGRAAVAYVERACDLCLEGEAAAMVTAPINKDAIHRAGSPYAGHTELLAERTGAERVTMLLTGPTLRVVHVSTHVALAEAVRRVTPERVGEVIGLAYQGCRALGIPHPRIAVAGLNPHAGEEGLFGDQERETIQPAVDAARAKGWDVSDPQPPDTVFLRASQGAYDIVVAMYHDQGHIPMKLLAFDEGVNVSLGLPIIRTSVDHGTAFDIAGTGRARETSLIAAIDVALQMVRAAR
jgi:4-hydroxythreonine-4-phosphate dehydrogenase